MKIQCLENLVYGKISVRKFSGSKFSGRRFSTLITKENLVGEDLVAL